MTDKKDSSDVVNGEPNGDTIEDAGTDKQSLVDANENLEKDDGIVEKTELETEIETQKSEEWYPDGGWGWAVVIGAVIIHVYVGGYMKSSGVMYLKFKDQFNQSAVATAWVFSLYTTFLLLLGESDDAWDQERQEFFFDRHPGVFAAILHYYRTEELHTDQNLCGNIIQGELDYWGLTELDIEPCCWGHYSKFKDHRETLAALDDNFTQQTNVEVWGEKVSYLQRFRHQVWNFIEEPSTSRGAKIYAVVSMFFVVLSIAIFCLETYHWFRVPIPGARPQNASDSYNAYYAANGAYCFRKELKTSYLFADTEPHPAMVYLDYVCAAYFTIEFIFRFSFSPSKLAFMKGALNVIDLLCLIPHLIAIILITVDPYGASKDTSSLFKSMLALRTVRILRIFKLMKHYSAFKILVYTIKVSTKELLLMVVFLFTGVLIFASVIFYTENETFDSIPVGFWWALVTMTTVGYGDVVPKTEGGYIIGCVCVLCGVLTVAFTVPIVVNNFTLYYSHAQSRIKLPVHKRKELKRKIFLKNQKSLEFLQKLKWKRDRNKREFTELDTIKSPRAPPCGQEATAEVNSPPKTKTTTPFVAQPALTYKPGSPGPSPAHGRVSPSPSPSPESIPTVSGSIDISIADSITLPGTPVDLADHTMKAESEQLLIECADADKKRKEERKRQLDLINQKREQRRQQLMDGDIKKRVHFGGGSKRHSDA